MATALNLFQTLLRKLTASEVDQNFINLRTNVDKLGGYTASLTPTANQIPVINASSVLALPGGTKFPTTQVASSDPNTLDDYRESSYAGTATGLTTAPTATVEFVRNGNQVDMTIPALAGVSNASTFTITGGPTPIRPSVGRIVACRVADNGGAIVWGRATVGTDGVITLAKDAAGTVFTATGNKSTALTTISYHI